MTHNPLEPISPTRVSIQPNIDTTSSVIIGVDEVGRGCIFGPMSVCACILPADFALDLTCPTAKNTYAHTPLAQLADSKTLTPKTRSQLAHTLQTTASYAIIDVSAAIIDQLNIHNATLLGMKSAIIALQKHYPHTSIFIDGIYAPQGFININTLKKGDQIHAAIAAASILAKVHRDALLDAYAQNHPQYGFAQHKGYPTRAHKNAITQWGILPEHRKSYAPIKNHNQFTGGATS